MLKKYEKSFSKIQGLVDILVILLCWAISYFIRFYYLPNAEKNIGLLFFKLAPLLVFITLYFFYQTGLYRSQRFTHRYREIFSLLKSNFFALVTFVLFIYFFGNERISRLTIVIYGMLSSFSLIITRLIVRNFLRSLRARGKNLRHILLVGNGQPLLNYIEAVKRYKDSGIQFMGWIDSEGLVSSTPLKEISLSYEELRKEKAPDSVIISYQGESSKKTEEFVSQNYNDLVPIQILPDLSYSMIGHQIDDFAGIPLLSVNQPDFNSFELSLKRMIDLLGSFFGLIVISPLLILIALLIKLSSKGPILYGQIRVGLDGSEFTMWKFRTMKVAGSEEDQTEWSSKENPRKTKLGHFLRSTSLDELPQLINVLIGQMSLIGPRPERPFFVSKFREEIPGYMLRHKMKSGITGWAQINGWRGDTDLNKRIECDIYYIKNWSLIFDIKILFLTFFKGFINPNAY